MRAIFVPSKVNTCVCISRGAAGADSSSTDNHATSALKFEVLYELLTIGVSVLLTDVDVPILQVCVTYPWAFSYEYSEYSTCSPSHDLTLHSPDLALPAEL